MPGPSTTTPLPLHQKHQSHRHAKPKQDYKRSRWNWHVKKPTYGPRRLAAKNHLIAMIGEYIGTTLFLMLAFGAATVANIPTTSVTGAVTEGQNATTAAAPNTSSLLYIAFGFGISLMVMVFVFFRVSGGLFNPAVSVAMALAGAVSPLRAVLLIIAQLLGGISGAALIDALLPGTLNVRTLRGGGIGIARAFWLETFLTGVLMLTILLLAAEPNRARHLAPLVIGFALFSCELVGVYWTGGSLNPARTFGPAVTVTEFSGYHWIYWVGPILGASIAAGLYRFLRILEYETVMGPEPEMGGGPTIQISHNANGSTLDVRNSGSTDTSSEVSGDDYLVEGTGFGDLLDRDDSEQGQGRHSSNTAQSITFPNYDERFNRLEGMMAQLLEAGQLKTMASRTSADSHPWTGAGTGRKSSVAHTLVEEPTNEKIGQA